jgi:hypothetical protein
VITDVGTNIHKHITLPENGLQATRYMRFVVTAPHPALNAIPEIDPEARVWPQMNGSFFAPKSAEQAGCGINESKVSRKTP